VSRRRTVALGLALLFALACAQTLSQPLFREDLCDVGYEGGRVEVSQPLLPPEVRCAYIDPSGRTGYSTAEPVWRVWAAAVLYVAALFAVAMPLGRRPLSRWRLALPLAAACFAAALFLHLVHYSEEVCTGDPGICARVS
jgi:hypothetical protein